MCLSVSRLIQESELEQGTMLIMTGAASVGLFAALVVVLLAWRRERAGQERLARCRTDFEAMEKAYVEAPLGLAMLDRELRYLRINRLLAEINGVSI